MKLYESMHALLYSLRTLVNFYMEVHLNFIFLTVRIKWNRIPKIQIIFQFDVTCMLLSYNFI